MDSPQARHFLRVFFTDIRDIENHKPVSPPDRSLGLRRDRGDLLPQSLPCSNGLRPQGTEPLGDFPERNFFLQAPGDAIEIELDVAAFQNAKEHLADKFLDRL